MKSLVSTILMVFGIYEIVQKTSSINKDHSNSLPFITHRLADTLVKPLWSFDIQTS
ncbi:MAG: hypothetical protein GY866_08560 [Proteobacteria bacterium]|nr:hypothetical protein [Pseudomonadota bacterium]